MDFQVKTGSSSRTYYATWSCVSDDEVCHNAEHEHAPIYCMWHGQTYSEHKVGAMCLDCADGRQWFFADDWSSPECRAMLEQEERSCWFRFVSLVDRLVMGWKWRNARDEYRRESKPRMIAE